ncbi:MAG: hypothetical protein A2655_02840 [Candidatus Yanofskybacteria bacterium RIFCSPHIGHO2_01_FULL_43_42]|uniref:Uncharacterized protein n=1 Tax=Candidatus Yanofskybacteria bacterium RIFCSPLOWO2_01_FULL_43_22 TaxID=1802695 RepID=A0A1F8GF14_9BACT|nr:MAG: hypothetical protein A2655_02840 [Candidatus Yanofskybacteria bacterium RIFCSPHIGHO2_01_FULL_43_42]OGN12947.1 MAG: hypothetical protein A3D48_03500 [Candidatus Yanofskybacteria bacterium RIFCSPHIGHO2_02_FULL_43_17]OGN23972.1 MAG: hypothetical protein A3A13_02755 [Candidatus Yanofskybacteria bacterium RIFCSPLOWO2_01_FULL_43_22]
MATKKVRKMKKDEIPVTAGELSDIEKQDLAATAPADDKGDGEASDRLPYHTFEPEVFQRWTRHENGLHLVPKYRWDMVARLNGGPLSVANTERIVRVDPALGRATCGFLGHGKEFVAYMVAFILNKPGQEGQLMTRDKYVTTDNPEGVVYMGCVVRVKDENNHVVPLTCCPEHVEAAQNAVELASARRDKDGKIVERGFRPPAQSMGQALIDIQAIVTKAEQRRDETQKAVEAYGGKRREFGGSPHMATSGRQGRERDPRERSIGNRG